MSNDTPTPRTDWEFKRAGKVPTTFLKHARQLERELTAAQAEIAELRAKCERLEHAGDALAEFLAPGPIPAESPTRVDYALGDWEFAKANPGGAHE